MSTTLSLFPPVFYITYLLAVACFLIEVNSQVPTSRTTPVKRSWRRTIYYISSSFLLERERERVCERWREKRAAAILCWEVEGVANSAMVSPHLNSDHLLPCVKLSFLLCHWTQMTRPFAPSTRLLCLSLLYQMRSINFESLTSYNYSQLIWYVICLVY